MAAALTSVHLVPESMHPSQFFTRREPICPERTLMAAVLTEVVIDLDKRTIYERIAAREFIQSDDRVWPFSFLNLCEALGLDGLAVRGALLDPDRAPYAPLLSTMPGGRTHVVAHRSACG